MLIYFSLFSSPLLLFARQALQGIKEGSHTFFSSKSLQSREEMTGTQITLLTALLPPPLHVHCIRLPRQD